MTTISKTIYRNDDQTRITVEVMRTIYGLDITPAVNLTEDENYEIERALDEAAADEWDEDSWQSEREMQS